MITATFTPEEIAAAGGHHMAIAHGAPTAEAFPTVLPKHTPAQVFGTVENPQRGLVYQAHGSTLVLDRAARIKAPILNTLRQVLDTSTLHISNGTDSVVSPGIDLRLIIGLRNASPFKVSGPLMDRLDIFATSPAIAAVDQEVITAARAAQSHRLADYGISCNGQLPPSVLFNDFMPPQAARQQLEQKLDRAQLSLRGYSRVLRVAWTLADMAGRPAPTAEDVNTATTLRTW